MMQPARRTAHAQTKPAYPLDYCSLLFQNRTVLYSLKRRRVDWCDRTRFEDWAKLVLGVYLFAVPFLFGTTEEAASSWNAYVVGAVVTVVATTRPRPH